jgi:uncharacterized damage-inducible protein DinB
MSNTVLTLPAAGEFPTYYGIYIQQVAASPLDQLLTSQPDELRALLGGCSHEQTAFRYSEGKWSVREVVGHVIDCERIFATRALCIARGEQQHLPGFDENAYVANAGFDARSMESLLEEFASVRAATISLVSSLSDADLLRRGIANNGTFTPRAIIWILVGHVVHHVAVLRERYHVA